MRHYSLFSFKGDPLGRLIVKGLLAFMSLILITFTFSTQIFAAEPLVNYGVTATTIGTHQMGVFTMPDSKTLRNYGFKTSGASIGDKIRITYTSGMGQKTVVHTANGVNWSPSAGFVSGITSFSAELELKSDHQITVCLWYVTAMDNTRYENNGALIDCSSSPPDPNEETKIVDGNYYYFGERDVYKYDYFPPSGATRYELHYLNSSGETQYKRDYENPPSGVHYLTCNGTYQMKFFNGANVIAESSLMTTSAIQDPTCSSYAGTGNGYQDFNSNKIKNGDGTVDLTWDAVPNAAKYEVYKDGQKVGETTETNFNDNSDGAHSIIAKDASGQIIGQSDLPAESGNSGGEECATLICACIESLRPALQDLKPAIDNLKPVLDQISDNTGGILNSINDQVVPELGQIKNILSEFKGEFQSDVVHTSPSVSDYPEIKLEDNKPPERSGVYIDNNTYFSDAGADPDVPDAFAPAPEPEEWKDLEGNEIARDDVIEISEPMETDEHLTKNENMERDMALEKGLSLERDEPLEVDRTQYQLRWKVVDGVAIDEE